MASMNPSSIFGGGGLGTTSTGPQSASIFPTSNPTSFSGNPSAGTTQAAPSTSFFGAQSQTQQQASQPSVLGQQTSEGQIRPSGQATQPAFFNSLLERGKKRPISALGQSSNFGELPSLQLGLDDIRRKARELGSGGPKEQNGLNTKAYVQLYVKNHFHSNECH